MTWINYDDDPYASGPLEWDYNTCKKYYFEEYAKRNKRFPRWGVKETTLLNKMLREYDTIQLAQMMVTAIENDCTSFAVFYSTADKWFDATKDWQWN